MPTNERISPDAGVDVATEPVFSRSRGVTPGTAARAYSESLSPESLEDFEPNERSEMLSRAFNVLAAGLMLLLLAPVMLIAALLVMLTSRGPVLYTQTRVGIDRRWARTRALHERRREDLGGIPFTIYKFRSMKVDAEVNGQAVWAKKDDDRVTNVGKFMRKSRVDELPQLFNVIRV